MKAVINTTQKLNFNQIMIGDENLSDILSYLHNNALSCLEDISIERQSENPNLEDIDAPLHRILNKIEKLQGL